METATRRRTSGMRSITRAIGQIGTPEYLAFNYDQMRQRLKRLEERMLDLKRDQGTVCENTVAEADRNALIDEYEAFDEQCMDAVATIETRLRELAPPPPVAQPLPGQANVAAAAPQNQPAVFQVTLPETTHDTWGPFDGDKMGWFDWKAKFVLAVHGNEKVSKANKLRYLGSALKGKAIDAIRKYDFVEVNYDQIWTTLQELYEKPYDVAYGYLNSFFALKKLGHRTHPDELRHMVNTTNELIRQVARPGYPVDQWDMVIVCSLHARLNSACRLEWDKVRGNNDRPTVDDMTKFLLQQATHAGNNAMSYEPMHIRVNNEYAGAPAAGSEHRERPIGSERKWPCTFCSSWAHDNSICPKYVTRTYYERKHMVEEHRLCMNCVKYGHFQHQCYSLDRCDMPQCNKARHHATLCPFRNKREDTVAATRFEDADPPDMSGYRIKKLVVPNERGDTYYYTSKDCSSSGRGRGKANKRQGEQDQS